MTTAALDHLINQLPAPSIIMGDFNSYNVLLGSNPTDTRGRIIENFISEHNLQLLNTGQPTRIGYNCETAIDLTTTTNDIEPMLQWSVSHTPWNSDHCLIFISIMSDSRTASLI